jgi:hypothetical protein
MCASESLCQWLHHFTDQLEGHNFNRYDTPMMALKKCWNM